MYYQILAHCDDYVVLGLTLYVRDDMTVHSRSVYCHGGDALLDIVRVLYLNVVSALAELSGESEITEAAGYTGGRKYIRYNNELSNAA